MRAVRNIGLLAVEGVQLLDVSGPLDVFAEANIQAGAEVYRPVVIAPRRGPLRASSGVRPLPDVALKICGVDSRGIHSSLLDNGLEHIANRWWWRCIS